MTKRIERSFEELYRDDPERADAVILGRKYGLDRRGFLEGAGLAAFGGLVGAAVPFGPHIPSGQRIHARCDTGAEGPGLS